MWSSVVSFPGSLLLGAVVASGLRYALPEAAIEVYYSRDLFLIVRGVLDTLFGWWPVAASPFLIVVLLVLIGWMMRRGWASGRTRIDKYLLALWGLLGGAALVVLLFFASWGLNYGRVSVPDQLDLASQKLTVNELKTELSRVANILVDLRHHVLLADSTVYQEIPPFDTLEPIIYTAATQQLERLDYPAQGRVRLRELIPGTLLRFGTSGIYFPLTGEANVDGGIHPLKRPTVMAHETMHGFGITDEGSCNFLAYLACVNSKDLRLRYTGQLMYYRYLASAVNRADRSYYQSFRSELPVGLVYDLDSINRSLDKFREVAPAVRDKIYDSYLKGQGVSDGLASYGRIIDLVVAWRSGLPRPQAASGISRLQTPSVE